MSKNVRIVSSDITSAAILTPFLFDSTPLLGGKGRTAVLRIPTAPVAGVMKLQGHDAAPKYDAVGAPVPPVSGDAGWYDVVTVNAANAAASPAQEIKLSTWMRVNVTTLQAGAAAFKLEFDGIQ